MRAMPSPTSRTRPTSRTSAPPPCLPICSTSTETISSALNLMTASLDELGSQILEPGLQTVVVQPVAGADGDGAEQVGIDLLAQQRLALHPLAQERQEAFALGIGERHRGGDVDRQQVAPLVEELL